MEPIPVLNRLLSAIEGITSKPIKSNRYWTQEFERFKESQKSHFNESVNPNITEKRDLPWFNESVNPNITEERELPWLLLYYSTMKKNIKKDIFAKYLALKPDLEISFDITGFDPNSGTKVRKTFSCMMHFLVKERAFSFIKVYTSKNPPNIPVPPCSNCPFCTSNLPLLHHLMIAVSEPNFNRKKETIVWHIIKDIHSYECTQIRMSMPKSFYPISGIPDPTFETHGLIQMTKFLKFDRLKDILCSMQDEDDLIQVMTFINKKEAQFFIQLQSLWFRDDSSFKSGIVEKRVRIIDMFLKNKSYITKLQLTRPFIKSFPMFLGCANYFLFEFFFENDQRIFDALFNILKSDSGKFEYCGLKYRLVHPPSEAV